VNLFERRTNKESNLESLEKRL